MTNSMKSSIKHAFVQEEDPILKDEIEATMNKDGYQVTFFDKSISLFELIALHPDLVVSDFKKNQFINCKELNLV